MNGEVRTEKSTVSVNSGFEPHPPLYQLCGERLILADHDDQQSYFNVLILFELHSVLKDGREKFQDFDCIQCIAFPPPGLDRIVSSEQKLGLSKV